MIELKVLDNLLSVAKGLLQGNEITPESYKEALTEAQIFLEHLTDRYFQLVSTNLSLNPVQNVVLEDFKTSIDNCAEALDELKLYLEEEDLFDLRHVEIGLDLIEEAKEGLIERLYDLMEELSLTAEEVLTFLDICDDHKGKTVQEGKDNYLEKIYLDGELEIKEEEVLTTNFLKLKENALAVCKDRSRIKEFLETVGWLKNLINSSVEEYSNLYFTEDEVTAELLKGDELLTEGLTEYGEAIEMMETFLEDGNTEHIHNGLDKAFQANRKLIELQKLTDKIVRYVEEEDGTYSEETLRNLKFHKVSS